jgi:hypothetical protein
MDSTTFLPALIGSALLSAPLSGQMIGGEWNERRLYDEPLTPEAYFGNNMSGGTDIDLDGVPDQIVGAPFDNAGGLFDAGSVFVYSGATGAELFHFSGTFVSNGLGWDVASADINADGVPDIFASTRVSTQGPITGSVYVWSGATGVLLYEISDPNTLNYGESLEVVADRNGDQIPDLLVGNSDSTVGGLQWCGLVDLRSGADGSLLHRWTGNAFQLNYGADVTELDDLNGDGVGEFAFGMPGYEIIRREGAVTVIDGATYQVLRSFTITFHGPEQQLGVAVANPGDVNGDGIGDLLVGATSSGVSYTGRAYVLDGASLFLNVLYDFPGRGSSDFFGESLCGAGDVDQDGFADVLIGAGQSGSGKTGYIELYSGRDGSLMKDWAGAAGDHLGRVAMAGDINGDGASEIMMGAWLEENGPGYVSIVGLDAYLTLSAQELSATPSTPVSYTLDFPASEGGRAYSLLLSLAGGGSTTVGGLEIPLADDPILQRMVQGLRPPILSPTRGLLDAQGDAQGALLGVPALSPLIGRRLMICAVTFDPVAQTGYLTSASRSVVVVP